MNNEKIGGGDEQPNEAYNKWANMADEVMSQNKNDWTLFEYKIKNPEDLATFRENMGRLDGRTQNYLNELPGNIDEIFGLGEKGTEMRKKVLSEIVNRTIEGQYVSSMTDEDGNHDEGFNLYMNDDGYLFSSKLDAEEYGKKDHEDLRTQNEHMIEDWIVEMEQGLNYKTIKEFDVNIHKLDDRTQNYLLNLPNNIEQLFKDKNNPYARPKIAQDIQSEIEQEIIAGSYTREHPTWGNDSYLHLNNGRRLYTYEDLRGRGY